MQKFYQGKKILVTGHTGFKGSWLCKILISMGADVVGYSLESNTTPNLFNILKLDSQMNSIIGDIRNLGTLNSVFEIERPEIVFHLAAQPIVLDSYERPVYTFETNVMGTVNVLECIRNHSEVKSFINITTDKVYKNNEWCWGYREEDALCGHDPYSNSKSCSELVTSSYKNSFFLEREIAVSTARAGNVIGGGDFSDNRIVPDCVRAMGAMQEIEVRNPNSVRPYQHVLEPLFCYMLIAKEQYEDKSLASEYNIGPNDSDCITTGELATIFTTKWGNDAKWHAIEINGPHEANFLKLDCSKIKTSFGWTPRWNVEEAIEKSVEWSKAYFDKQDMNTFTQKQIDEFFKIKNDKTKRDGE